MVRFTAQKLLVLTLLFGCFSLRAMEEENDDQKQKKASFFDVFTFRNVYVINEETKQIEKKIRESKEKGDDAVYDLQLIHIKLKEKKANAVCAKIELALAALMLAWMTYYHHFGHENLSGEGGGPSGLC